MDKGHKVAGGDRLGKTIIFAKNQRHAEFIQQRFDIQYPEYAGHFARVITHGMTYAQSLIDDFSTPDKAPHIAISVDMLDTGIDVPEVVNLVFFKLVRSKTKFWQMIGRGTRLCPDLFGPGRGQEELLRLRLLRQPRVLQPGPARIGRLAAEVAEPAAVRDPPRADHRAGRPRQARRHRSSRGIRAWKPSAGCAWDTARQLHDIVAGMNLDNFLVRPHRKLVEQYAQWPSWSTLTTEAADEVAENLAGLPSSFKDDDEDAKRFDLLILRRQLAQLEGDAVAAERLREQVQNIATGLLGQTAIPSVAAQQSLLDEVASDEWWIDVTLPMLEAGPPPTTRPAAVPGEDQEGRRLHRLRRTNSARPPSSSCPASPRARTGNASAPRPPPTSSNTGPHRPAAAAPQQALTADDLAGSRTDAARQRRR